MALKKKRDERGWPNLRPVSRPFGAGLDHSPKGRDESTSIQISAITLFLYRFPSPWVVDHTNKHNYMIKSFEEEAFFASYLGPLPPGPLGLLKVFLAVSSGG